MGQFDDDDLKEEIKESLSDTGIDEWTYLDTFFKRYNKVKLDHLAIEKERQRLEKENVQLRSILKQFLDGVSVNEDVLSQPNALMRRRLSSRPLTMFRPPYTCECQSAKRFV